MTTTHERDALVDQDARAFIIERIDHCRLQLGELRESAAICGLYPQDWYALIRTLDAAESALYVGGEIARGSVQGRRATSDLPF
jgi:hypothetical protein